MSKLTSFFLAGLLLSPSVASATSDGAGQSGCTDMEAWDAGMGMCMPLPMPGMPMRMLMVHGNAFGAYISEQGPRGRDAVSAPNMFMVDLGTSLGDRQYLNLDYMGTSELWAIRIMWRALAMPGWA